MPLQRDEVQKVAADLQTLTGAAPFRVTADNDIIAPEHLTTEQHALFGRVVNNTGLRAALVIGGATEIPNEELTAGIAQKIAEQVGKEPDRIVRLEQSKDRLSEITGLQFEFDNERDKRLLVAKVSRTASVPPILSGLASKGIVEKGFQLEGKGNAVFVFDAKPELLTESEITGARAARGDIARR